MTAPFCSVVMINHNGGEYLRRALRSLAEDLDDVWRRDPCFELLVVDNNSTDGSPAVIKSELAGKPYPWRVVHEEEPGVNSARNAGLRAAAGDLIVFTDSDLKFHRGWLDAYLGAARENPDCLVFAGRVKVGPVEGEAPAWLDLEGPYRRPAIVVQCEYGDEPQRMAVGEGAGPVGPNMAFRRQLFDAVGPFDTRFGLRPGSFVPGAEAEFFDRIGRLGYEFVYVPGAAVDHPLKRDQIAKAYFLKRLHGIGRVRGRLARLRGERCKRVLGLSGYALRQLAGETLRYALSWLRFAPKRRFWHRGQMSVLLGHLHEDWTATREKSEARNPKSETSTKTQIPMTETATAVARSPLARG